MNEGYGRSRLVQRYLNLLEASLTGMLIEDKPCDPWSGGAFDPNTTSPWEGTGLRSPSR